MEFDGLGDRGIDEANTDPAWPACDCSSSLSRLSHGRLPGYAGDEADIEFLLRKLRPKSLREVEELFERFFPDDVLPDRTRILIERVIKEDKT